MDNYGTNREHRIECRDTISNKEQKINMNLHIKNHEIEVYVCPLCTTLFIDLIPEETNTVTCSNCLNAFSPKDILYSGGNTNG